MAWVVTGSLLVLGGIASEVLLGSPRHVFDWSWPSTRYPKGDDNIVRVRCGRIALLLGVVILTLGGILELLG